MSDVTTTTPSSGEALVWDGTKWTNGTPTLDVDDLNDVTITTPTDGEILVYNDGVWENQANPASTQNFAPDYDDTQTYNTNDKVIYQGLLYICNDDNVTGTWDATKWDAFTVADISGDSIPMSPNDPDKVADRITALESGKLNVSAIKTLEGTGTTDATGIVTSTALGIAQLDYDHHNIIAVHSSNNGCVVNVGQYNKNFYYVCTSAQGLANPLANTSVTIRVVYMKI